MREGGGDQTKKRNMLTSEDVRVVDQISHVLMRPDTYIGSIDVKKTSTYVCLSKSGVLNMKFKQIEKPNGAYQLIDELLVNASDAAVSDQTVRTIMISANKETGVIQVYNNGQGIDTRLESSTSKPVPEVVFGHLLSGTNLESSDKNEYTGGRNGLGAKLANIFSDEFNLKIVDTMQLSHPGKSVLYEQKWSNHMSNCSDAIITVRDIQEEPEGQVCITLKLSDKVLPSGITDDFIRLLRRRALDIAACTPPNVGVIFNGNMLAVKDFNDYAGLFVGKEARRVRFKNDFFDVIICRHPDSIEGNASNGEASDFSSFSISQSHCVSFVNGISTDKGGEHANRIIEQIEWFIKDEVKKKLKNASYRFPLGSIMDYFFLFINAKIRYPKFSSQTKDEMVKDSLEFHDESKLPEDFLKKIIKELDFFDELVAKSSQTMAIRSAKKYPKIGRGRGRPDIEKLEDANMAGIKGQHNVLILTEGDSAKTFAVTGLEKLGRDNYGVFPLKGKPLNVTNASENDIQKNEEYSKIKTIIGLEDGKEYDEHTVKKLRYQAIWVISDADPDGIHIRGLCMEMFRCRFPSLLKGNFDFFKIFITPQIVAKKGQQRLFFYNQHEFDTWNASGADHQTYTIVYLKGLGSINRNDALKFFSDIPNHVKTVKFNKQMDFELMDMAFNKDRVEERRDWNNKYVQLGENAPRLDYKKNSFHASEFIKKELVLFSIYTNANKLPHVMDGLKPCTRKVMQYFLLHPKEVKVNNATGLISSKYNYHHGEKSMHDAIVGMNQFFVGSNQIPYLKAEGQFGSRLMGGEDASSPRYISTSLGDYMDLFFVKEDLPVLEDTVDEKDTCEKVFLAPIIPTCMINGTFGIGMGWKGGMHKRNISDVIECIKTKISGNHPKSPQIDFMGFQGRFTDREKETTATSHGRYELKNENKCLVVTELPLKVWTSNFADNLKTFMKGFKASSIKKRKRTAEAEDTKREKTQPFVILDVRNNSSDQKVYFEIEFETPIRPDQMEELETKLQLRKRLDTLGLVFISPDGKTQTYNNTNEVIDAFYTTRLAIYKKRKAYNLKTMKDELNLLKNKINFIEAIIQGTVVLKNKPVQAVITDLSSKGFHTREESFEYLLEMRQDAITSEKICVLKTKQSRITEKIVALESTTPEKIWYQDIEKLEQALRKDGII